MSNIYHPKWPTVSNISAAVDTAMTMASESKVQMCFNGTLVTVFPDDDKKEAYRRWMYAREHYQKTSDKSHPALCPECQSKAG